MKKPLEYNYLIELRNLINKHIHSKTVKHDIQINKVNFIEGDILIKDIDYYYTNPIARSSKVMNECRKISKNLSFKGIEKAS